MLKMSLSCSISAKCKHYLAGTFLFGGSGTGSRSIVIALTKYTINSLLVPAFHRIKCGRAAQGFSLTDPSTLGAILR
jgi:hypothetical protein